MVSLGHRSLVSLSQDRVFGQVVAGLVLAGVAAGLVAVLESRGVLFGATAVVLVLGSTWFAMTERTSLALLVFMVYLGILDGYLKLSTGSSQVTAVRDILLYALVVGVLVRAQAQGKPLKVPPLSVWVLGFIVVVLAQIANPNGGSLFHSLAGVRQHLEFVPLFFLAYAFVRTTRALRIFLLVLLVVAAANGVVSYYQFTLTPEQLSAWGPGYAERVGGTGSFEGSQRTFFDDAGTTHARPFGLGSDAGSGGVLGALALAGAIALGSSFGRLRYQLLALALAIGAVTAIVTSQGRAVIVVAVVSVIAYGLLAATSQRKFASFAGIVVVAAVCFLTVSSIVGREGSSFRYESLAASKILQTTRTERPTPAAVQEAITRFPLGAGLAVAGPATGTPGGGRYTGTLNAESAYSFLILETGVPGALLLIGFTVAVLLLGMSRCRLEPDPEARRLLAAIIAPVAGLFVLFYAGAVTPSPPAAPYLWFAGGVVSYWLVTRQRELRHDR